MVTGSTIRGVLLMSFATGLWFAHESCFALHPALYSSAQRYCLSSGFEEDHPKICCFAASLHVFMRLSSTVAIALASLKGFG